MTRPSVSVIIPTLNEAATLPRLLDALRPSGADEVIVVDGGSTDGTPALAQVAGASVLSGPRGRGRQLHAGAEAASGEAFLFLHADTLLPPSGVAAVRAALSRPEIAGGAFRLQFDRRHPMLGLYAAATRFDTALTSFGDQAFFASRTAYHAAGGFPAWSLMEDVELRRRLKRVGRFVKLRPRVTTSARRFEADGVARRQLRNGMILALFALGVSPERLSRMYARRS